MKLYWKHVIGTSVASSMLSDKIKKEINSSFFVRAAPRYRNRFTGRMRARISR